jgi:hypothetical protein
MPLQVLDRGLRSSFTFDENVEIFLPRRCQQLLIYWGKVDKPTKSLVVAWKHRSVVRCWTDSTAEQIEDWKYLFRVQGKDGNR